MHNIYYCGFTTSEVSDLNISFLYHVCNFNTKKFVHVYILCIHRFHVPSSNCIVTATKQMLNIGFTCPTLKFQIMTVGVVHVCQQVSSDFHVIRLTLGTWKLMSDKTFTFWCSLLSYGFSFSFSWSLAWFFLHKAPCGLHEEGTKQMN